MNKNYIINGVLGIAVIILFILHFTDKKRVSKDDIVATGDSTVAKLPVAYINSDSLLLNYGYAKDLNETLLRKVESSKATLNQKGSKLQADMLEFQRKYENNAFLSQERAQEEYQGLMKRQQELQAQTEKSQQDLALEQAKMNQQMIDTVSAALAVFNKGPQYQIIFNNMSGNSAVLLANKAYNITAEVTEYLNKRYVPVKKTK